MFRMFQMYAMFNLKNILNVVKYIKCFTQCISKVKTLGFPHDLHSKHFKQSKCLRSNSNRQGNEARIANA